MRKPRTGPKCCECGQSAIYVQEEIVRVRLYMLNRYGNRSAKIGSHIARATITHYCEKHPPPEAKGLPKFH